MPEVYRVLTFLFLLIIVDIGAKRAWCKTGGGGEYTIRAPCIRLRELYLYNFAKCLFCFRELKIEEGAWNRDSHHLSFHIANKPLI